MKQIINGKKYDTDTAELLATWSNEYYANDFRTCSESLYRKRTGEFFVYGEGGAASRWSRPVDNGSIGGNGIEPLTEAQAREWVEGKANDRYEDIFGEVEE